MRIDGITCCVGRKYTEYLKQTLPMWVETLDSVTVVTSPPDYDVAALARQHGCNIVVTDAFTKYGAYLNKGAALSMAYARSWPQEWAIAFDCDILPERDWRPKVAGCLRRDAIHGAPRDHRGFNPIGYFQLWHAEDERTWRWPTFDNWHSHAGAYDTDFMELWPREKRIKLPTQVKHLSERRLSWFGDGIGARKSMRALIGYGLRKYRIDAQNGVGRLDLPPTPLVRVTDRDELRHVALLGPFDARAVYSIDELDETKTFQEFFKNAS